MFRYRGAQLAGPPARGALVAVRHGGDEHRRRQRWRQGLTTGVASWPGDVAQSELLAPKARRQSAVLDMERPMLDLFAED